MKKNKKGFTLIELLAVIIILGVLMLIAIPSVTEYIGNSKKKTYLSTADAYMSAAALKVNNLDLPITDPNTTYYIPISCINLEKGGRSPYGEWTNAYVVVTTDGTKYSYYWTSIDAAGYAIPLTYSNSLNTDSIVTNLADLDLSVGVGGRSNIVVFNANGTIATTASATSTIADNSSLSEGTVAASTDVSCFEYAVLDQDKLIDMFSTMENANSFITALTGQDSSIVLNKVVIDGYYEHQTDGTTDCPTNIVIPNKIEDKTVVMINMGAFYTYYEEETGGGETPTNNTPLEGGIRRLKNDITPVVQIEGIIPITSVTLPSGLIILGPEAFKGKGITSINIPSSLKYIGYGSFSNNKISNLNIPGTVGIVDDSAFLNNTLTSLTIQNGVVTIGPSAFGGNSLTTVTIPGSVQTISEYAFAYNSLTSVTISEGVTDIEYGAFESNNLTTVALPSSLLTKCNESFDGLVAFTPGIPTWTSRCCGCND